VLGLDDVREVVANVARYDAYDASAALLAGDTARYARVIEGLRGEGEAPTFVLWAIAEDLRALARIQAGTAEGRPLDALLRESRVWGPRQASIKAALRRLPAAAVGRALAHASLIDRAIKGVARLEAWDEFLKLGLKLAHGSEA
jgi:DNA polymerase-3 subunit delta